MPKVTNPTTFSKRFGVTPARMKSLGVLDPTLALDTKLFIDPLLFPTSHHSEIRGQAVTLYRDHFEMVIRLLVASQKAEDVAWRNARRMLQFHEIRGTCLGYGANSIHGSGFGPKLTNRVVQVGKEIVDLGIHDPDLFPAMALFEGDIGPDRISDMATNVIRAALVAFNGRILRALELRGKNFDLRGVEGEFLPNPLQPKRTPIILVPRDILRKLPIARDWDGVARAAAKNEALRSRVNRHIGHIWAAKAKRDKEELRGQALATRQAFQAMLDAIHGVPRHAYDIEKDPEGLLVWARLADDYTRTFPLSFKARTAPLDLDAVFNLVTEIVAQFRHLIEARGLNNELYQPDGRPRYEKTAQRLFFAVSYSYCKANNVDISPELDVGTGKVDFKFSTAFDARVLVELKLSTNPKLLAGYDRQLETYKRAEETMRAIYLVIDVGHLGQKDEALTKRRNATLARGAPASVLEFVDGRRRPPASKR